MLGKCNLVLEVVADSPPKYLLLVYGFSCTTLEGDCSFSICVSKQ